MLRSVFSFLLLFIFAHAATAQQTREELEKQRVSLKKEIEDAQKLLSSNKVQLKANLTTFQILNTKVNLQDRVVENLSKDLHILDNNIYTIQKDINKYDRLLDTLKQEYAKSMVYAYKNRGNYEFLNFIFSADNFNDAIKRVAYLKSYRNYREMQGENILRTQELRGKRLEDLGASKQAKNTTLTVQSKEMQLLEEQKQQQNNIVAQLKKEGKTINTQIAAKQKQMAKINNAVKAAIARAMKEEEDRRRAAERNAALAAAAATKESDRQAALIAKNTAKPTTGTTGGPASPTVKANTPVATTPKVPKAEPVTKNYNSESIALSSDFRSNIGRFQWPVDNGAVIQHKGITKLESGTNLYNAGITIKAEIGAPVKAIFTGVVILAVEIEEGVSVVTIKHGDYYTTYSNITSVSVKKDQEVATNQVIGRVAANLDGVGSIDFQTAKGKADADPEAWLRRR